MLLNNDFDRAFKLGQSFYGQVLGCKVVNNNLNATRLGILVSTKISKKAPIRNKLKRQIREAFRGELPQLVGGKDVVIVVLKPILDKEYQYIKDNLKSGLRNLKLYKK